MKIFVLGFLGDTQFIEAQLCIGKYGIGVAIYASEHWHAYFPTSGKTHHIALKDAHKSCSYQEFDRRTSQFANFLLSEGIRRGDRVAMLSENSTDYVELLVAGAKIGAIIACQNWRLAEPELTHCISLVAPKMLLTSPRHAQKAKALPLQLKTYILDASFADLRNISKLLRKM